MKTFSLTAVLFLSNRTAYLLTVKAPGGHVAVERFFDGFKWQGAKGGIEFRDGVLYSLPITAGPHWCPVGSKAEPAGNTNQLLYITKEFDKIFLIAPGIYKREKLNGQWTTYDSGGRILSFGDRRGTLAHPLYQVEGDTADLIGIADRNHRQVIWYEYNADDKISAAHDSQNRRVEYFYTDGLLTRGLGVGPSRMSRYRGYRSKTGSFFSLKSMFLRPKRAI